jgi:hypothetical protein
MELNYYEKKCCTWHVKGDEILFYVSARPEIFWNRISNMMTLEREKGKGYFSSFEREQIPNSDRPRINARLVYALAKQLGQEVA